MPFCEKCGAEHVEGQRFCERCGAPTTRLIPCPSCDREVSRFAAQCPHCGHPLRTSGSAAAQTPPAQKSDGVAGCLGLFFGPVGLWYKGHWAAGFAWLVIAIIIIPMTGLLAAPLFWVGMAIHAASVKAK